jgi:hypothetical protein
LERCRRGRDAAIASRRSVLGRGFHKADGLPEKRIDQIEHIVKKWKTAYGAQAAPGKPGE